MYRLGEGFATIIAEAGTAHADPRPHRRLEKALALVETAHRAGADAIKFQWFYEEGDCTIRSSMFCQFPGDEARIPRWQASIMPEDDWAQVKQAAEARGIGFLASAFQPITVMWLGRLKLEATKVASRAAKLFPYDFPGLPKPFLISMGMAPPPVIPEGAILLECEAEYPSTKGWGGVLRGFSDHSGASFLGIDAIRRGCKLIEVHFYRNEIDAGPDLPACLNPTQLKLLCEARDYYGGSNEQAA